MLESACVFGTSARGFSTVRVQRDYAAAAFGGQYETTDRWMVATLSWCESVKVNSYPYTGDACGRAEPCALSHKFHR